MNRKGMNRIAAYYARKYDWYAALLQHSDDMLGNETPYLTADILEQHYYNSKAPEGCYVYRTSGTSGGRRKMIAYSEADERRYLAVKTRLFAQLAGDRPIRRAFADMGTGHAAATSIAIFKELGWENEAIAYDEPIERHIERLTQFRPDLLYTMPSLLERIACALDDPASLGIQCIITVGEAASPQWRSAMASTFGIDARDVMDTYGSIEIGTIAWFDDNAGCYRLAEGIHAEAVAPAAIGLADTLASDEAALVLTSTQRAEFPAIRFVTGDVVRGFQPASEHAGATFEAIVRRIGPELKHGEKISIHDIEAAVFAHAKRVQVRAASSANRLILYLYGPDATPDRAARIEAEIGQRVPEIGAMIHGGMLPRIEIVLASSESEMPQGSVKQKKWHQPTDGN
ncbi:coenzyme F390 synthetase-like protein [Paenibacillus curdlanolyticus YK9]|uniref:Coenzyme F390 synthetase-like protein n=1 Tax=Paenibacillus curdlanolyticus YK9 TaxID=717606 RepID=E0IDQ4_9BACL|nr:hypothetical protein [Paenibacillus curdlanolyticus]EFM09258.1 coenzyme F390 synthetase-like protein [Paenibacillus curdlanolyticus YK9]